MNPLNVHIHYQSDGRASGEADVDFSTHEEAKEAMFKDRATMREF
jgi:heterogeneous nuclear ribonucleoprotein F/H